MSTNVVRRRRSVFPRFEFIYATIKINNIFTPRIILLFYLLVKKKKIFIKRGLIIRVFVSLSSLPPSPSSLPSYPSVFLLFPPSLSLTLFICSPVLFRFVFFLLTHFFRIYTFVTSSLICMGVDIK